MFRFDPTDESSRSPFLNLGVPSNRKQVKVLEKWIQHMCGEIDSDESLNELGRNRKLRTIFRFSFLEIVRQVSVQCIERGELLNNVLQKFIELTIKYLIINN